MSSGDQSSGRDDPGRQRGLQLDHDHLLEARGHRLSEVRAGRAGQRSDLAELRQQDEQAVRRLMAAAGAIRSARQAPSARVGGGGR